MTAVYRETEGNPFFLTEVVHLLEAKEQQSTGGGQDAALAFTIPQSVQAAIGRRLHPLSANCQHLLQIAAVVGREFSVETLATVGQQIGISAPEDRLFDLLEEAVALRVILEVPAVVRALQFLACVNSRDVVRGTECTAPRAAPSADRHDSRTPLRLAGRGRGTATRQHCAGGAGLSFLPSRTGGTGN